MYYADVKELNAQLLVRKNQEEKEVSELMRERDEARLKVEQLERVLDRSDEHKFRLSHDFQPISPPPKRYDISESSSEQKKLRKQTSAL